jgi:hypothetical protein
MESAKSEASCAEDPSFWRGLIRSCVWYVWMATTFTMKTAKGSWKIFPLDRRRCRLGTRCKTTETRQPPCLLRAHVRTLLNPIISSPYRTINEPPSGRVGFSVVHHHYHSLCTIHHSPFTIHLISRPECWPRGFLIMIFLLVSTAQFLISQITPFGGPDAHSLQYAARRSANSQITYSTTIISFLHTLYIHHRQVALRTLRPSSQPYHLFLTDGLGLHSSPTTPCNMILLGY